MRLPARPALAAAAVVVIVLVVGLLTLGDYGLTFDEPIRARSGDDWWRFLATWDHRYLPVGWFANLGASFDMLGSGVAKAYRGLGGSDDYVARHALVLACGIAGMAGTYALGRRTLSPWLAVLALVMLALTPRYYGPCFNNPKDIPFATAFVWAMYGLTRLLQEPSRRSAILGGVLAGLCTGVRPFGAVFIALGALACLWPILEVPAKQRRSLLGITVGVGLVVATLSWPILWIRGPWFLLQALAEVPEGPTHEYFGQIYRAAESPASYGAVWLAITLPLPTLLLALGGIGHLASLARTVPRRRALWIGALLGVWILVPVALPGIRHMPMYSAARHFVFVMPALCLLAAVGWGRLMTFLRAPWQLAAACTLLIVGYADVLVSEVRLHPYEDLYFSRLIGGIRGARGSFDIAYYGETYREAFGWLAANTTAPAHVNTVGGVLTFEVPAHYASKLGMVYQSPAFEYFVSQVRAHHEGDLPGEVVHTVAREGVPLAVVVKVAKMRAPVSAWTDGPWRPLPTQDGKVALDGAGSTLALSFVSPREQIVDLYLGYVGAPEIALTSLRPPRKIALPRSYPPAYPAMLRVPVEMVAGVNVVLVQLSQLDHDAGVFVQYPADSDLTQGPGPDSARPNGRGR